MIRSVAHGGKNNGGEVRVQGYSSFPPP